MAKVICLQSRAIISDNAQPSSRRTEATKALSATDLAQAIELIAAALVKGYYNYDKQRMGSRLGLLAATPDSKVAARDLLSDLCQSMGNFSVGKS